MRQVKYCSNGKVGGDDLVKQLLEDSHLVNQVDCIDPSGSNCSQCRSSYSVLFEKEDGNRHIVTAREMADFLASLSKITRRKYN